MPQLLAKIVVSDISPYPEFVFNLVAVLSAAVLCRLLTHRTAAAVIGFGVAVLQHAWAHCQLRVGGYYTDHWSEFWSSPLLGMVDVGWFPDPPAVSFFLYWIMPLSLSAVLVRQLRPTPPRNTFPLCGNCRYDLRGSLHSNTCPECGAPFTVPQVEAQG